jgi:hypothetical protein
MDVQELCQRYPNVGQIVSLANENREHSPEIARICDFIAGLCVDLIRYLPQVAPAPAAPVARFDPYTGQQVAPFPSTVFTPQVGTPGLSQGWPQPGASAPIDDKAELRALLAQLAAKL